MIYHKLKGHINFYVALKIQILFDLEFVISFVVFLLLYVQAVKIVINNIVTRVAIRMLWAIVNSFNP